MKNVYYDTKEMAPGWYAIGFEDFNGEITWGSIYRYLGNSGWADELGESVEIVYDSNFQLQVSINGADAYALQGAS